MITDTKTLLKFQNNVAILRSTLVDFTFRFSNLLNKNANAKTTRNEIESSKNLNLSRLSLLTRFNLTFSIRR